MRLRLWFIKLYRFIQWFAHVTCNFLSHGAQLKRVNFLNSNSARNETKEYSMVPVIFQFFSSTRQQMKVVFDHALRLLACYA